MGLGSQTIMMARPPGYRACIIAYLNTIFGILSGSIICYLKWWRPKDELPRGNLDGGHWKHDWEYLGHVSVREDSRYDGTPPTFSVQ